MDCTKNKSKDETPTAQKPTKNHLSSQSSPDYPSAAPQGIPQQAPSVHSVVIRPTPVSTPTPQKQRHSKPNGVKYLLNPTAEDSVGGHQAATSRPATLPPASMKNGPSGDITLPSITPALVNLHHPPSRSTTPRSPTRRKPYFIRSSPPTTSIKAQQPSAVFPRDQASALTGSGPLPSEIVMAPSMPCAAHPPPVPPPRSSTRVQTQLGGTGNPASQNSSPPPAPFQLTSTRKPPSHFFTPFTSTGPTSMMPQPAFNMEAFDTLTSEILGQSQCQMMVLETEQGLFRAPIDAQAASRVADENASAMPLPPTASDNDAKRRRKRLQTKFQI